MTKAYLEVDDVKRLERAATCLRDRLLIRRFRAEAKEIALA